MGEGGRRWNGGSKGERRRKKRMKKRNKERRKGKKKGQERKADGVGERGRKKPQISAYSTDEGTSMEGQSPALVPRHHSGPLLFSLRDIPSFGGSCMNYVAANQDSDKGNPGHTWENQGTCSEEIGKEGRPEVD